MKEYLKTLFPYRWIFPTIIYLIISLLYLCMFKISEEPYAYYFTTTEKILYYVLTAVFILVMDYTIGFGRSETNPKKRTFGIIFLISSIAFYVWYNFEILSLPFNY